MPVTPKDKPIQTLREETIDTLIMNYGHGHLSLDAFERRLDQAFGTTREPISPQIPMAPFRSHLECPDPLARQEDIAAGLETEDSS